MPRRHEDHQPVDLAALDRLQLVGDLLVVLGAFVKRVGVFSEPRAASASPAPPSLRFSVGKDATQALQALVAKAVEVIAMRHRSR
jgi:hypothetical protein